jgi:hypothetical protein
MLRRRVTGTRRRSASLGSWGLAGLGVTVGIATKMPNPFSSDIEKRIAS